MVTKEIKERIIDQYDLEEEEYKELEDLGLVPYRGGEAQKAKAEELFARELKKDMDVFNTYTYEELEFLGRMDLSRLQRKSQALAEYYMSF